MARSLTLTISWKNEPSLPVRKSKLRGYESIKDARKQLRTRRPDRNWFDLPNGFGYEEAFSCQGETGTLVFTITDESILEQREAA